MTSSFSHYLIPATSANIGPGFDSFGMAFQCYNKVTLRLLDASEQQTSISTLSHLPICQKAAQLFFQESGIAPLPFEIKLQASIPQARGLGSSATLRLGILLGLNELTNSPLSETKVLSLCIALEGHADNTMAAFYGGFTMVEPTLKPELSILSTLHYPISEELTFLLLIPDQEVPTDQARLLLPKDIPLSDAVANTAYGAKIAVAFATQNYQLLQGAFKDYLHQKYRTPLLPFLPKALEVAESAGALGGWLSGSGSTIAIVIDKIENTYKIETALQELIATPFQLWRLQADNQGVRRDQKK